MFRVGGIQHASIRNIERVSARRGFGSFSSRRARSSGLLNHTLQKNLTFNGPLRTTGTNSSRGYWWSSKPKPTPEVLADDSKLTPESLPAASFEPTQPISNSDISSPSSSVAIHDPAQLPEATLLESTADPINAVSSLPLDTISEPLANQAALALSTIPASALGSFYFPIGAIQHLLVGFSSLFPTLPAWEVILITSMLIRAGVAPWAIDQMRGSNKMTSIKPRMELIQEEIKNADNAPQKQLAALKLQKLFKENDIRPGRMFGNVIITLIPSLFSFFAVRRFCTADPSIPGMVAGGAGSWGIIGDLTLADPTFVLPAIAFVAFQGQMTVMQWEQMVPDKRTWQAHMPNLMRIMMVLTTPVFAFLPSGVFVYFIGTATWGILQGVLLRIPLIRAYLKVPPKVTSAGKAPSFLETLQKVISWFSEKRKSATAGW